MSKYDPVPTTTAVPAEQYPVTGGLGKNLYSLKRVIRYYHVIMVLYTAVTFSMLVWAATGPPLSGAKRVLRINTSSVDSLHSGLALSIFLTPMAIVIRKISKEIGLYHPFAIAAQKPVRLSDFDRMTDPGPLSLPVLFSYSKLKAAIQTILMLAGAFLVPIGTLAVTPSRYTPVTVSETYAGMPTQFGAGMTMSIAMDVASDSSPSFSDTMDSFLTEVKSMFVGTLVGQSGFVGATDSSLGPLETTNLTYMTGVSYSGLVSYNWDSGCQVATANEIKYKTRKEEYAWMVNFTFPDGTVRGGDVWNPATYLWSSNKQMTSNKIPVGGATYFASACAVSATEYIPEDKSSLIFQDGMWISLVKCTPSLSWEISSCTWNGSTMIDCIPDVGTNSTVMDDKGLNALSYYLTGVIWSFYNSGSNYVLGLAPITIPLVYYSSASGTHQYQAPTLQNYDNLFGLVAQSIASVSTSGYYGVAAVTTYGGEARTVYAARLGVMAVVFLVLLLATLASMADIFVSLIQRLPHRRTTFLTIATSVRGPWWDRQLFGGCALDEEELRKRNTAEVKFGADAIAVNHIGLAPQVYEINRAETYFGIGGETKGKY